MTGDTRNAPEHVFLRTEWLSGCVFGLQEGAPPSSQRHFRATKGVLGPPQRRFQAPRSVFGLPERFWDSQRRLRATKGVFGLPEAFFVFSGVFGLPEAFTSSQKRFPILGALRERIPSEGSHFDTLMGPRLSLGEPTLGAPGEPDSDEARPGPFRERIP